MVTINRVIVSDFKFPVDVDKMAGWMGTIWIRNG
jgi:hypothetical protein